MEAPGAPLCVRLGTVREADLPALELLATILATEREACELLDKQGIVSATGAGGLKPHPAMRMAETARGQAIALLDRFGLSPRARKGIDALWDADDGDE